MGVHVCDVVIRHTATFMSCHFSDTNTSLCLGVNLSVCPSGAEEVDVKAGRSGVRENRPTEGPPSSSGRCECVRLCLRLCLVVDFPLTRLPRLPAEVEGNHIGGSAGASAASHGETEVPALPENVQLVTSHPVGTSCSDHLPHLPEENNSFKLAAHFWREAKLV